MSAKKFTVFCKIIDYIDSFDTEFADVIRLTCNDGILNSTRNKPGLTFLLPSKEERKNIIDNAYGKDLATVEKASNQLQALMINNSYAKPRDIKDDKYVANCLHKAQVIEVEKVDGEVVHFKGGASATVDTKFICSKIDTSRSPPKGVPKFAVWNLTGMMPIKTRDAERRPLMNKDEGRAGFKGKGGAYDLTKDHLENERLKIMIVIENLYLLNEQQRRMANMKYNNVYLAYNISLLNYIAKIDIVLFNSIMWLVSLDKTDLYYLIDPHSPDATHLVSDEIIAGWWKKHADYTKVGASDVKAVKTAITTWLTDTKQQRETMKKMCGEDRSATGLGVISTIVEKYAEISAGDFYKDDTIKNYYSRDNLKLRHDELRFIVKNMFDKFEADQTCDVAKFRSNVGYIGDYLNSPKSAIIDLEKLKYSIQPIDKIKFAESFINTSWYCYFPTIEGEELRASFRPKFQKQLAGVITDSHFGQFKTKEAFGMTPESYLEGLSEDEKKKLIDLLKK